MTTLEPEAADPVAAGGTGLPAVEPFAQKLAGSSVLMLVPLLWRRWICFCRGLGFSSKGSRQKQLPQRVTNGRRQHYSFAVVN